MNHKINLIGNKYNYFISKVLIVAISFLIPQFSLAARVAVTDSGTDFSHEWLKDKVLINLSEISGNLVDDDRNGKVDDIWGWNFVDDYRKVFFPEHLNVVDEQMFKIFEVLSRIQAETATEEDLLYWKQNIKDLEGDEKAAIISRLNFYGQYAHSTHCSGIITAISPNSKILSNRVFPDTPPDTSSESAQLFSKGIEKKKTGVVDIFYKVLAAISNGTFQKVADYIGERKIDVANYSLGMSLQTMARLALSVRGVKAPTPEQVSEETKRVAAQYEPVGKKWMASASNTLFVVAAGNDSSDNDKLPVFPAVVRAENAITVAASKGNSSLASFSNFGINSVDIAAPGVAIRSSVPSKDHNQLLPMSGTSMATPYVVGVAANIKDLNPKLTPSQIKLILMSTVDIKEWLKTKVISSGVVNPQRAYLAAEKSATMSIDESIAYARTQVKDLPEVKSTVLKEKLNSISSANSESLAEIKKEADSLAF